MQTFIAPIPLSLYIHLPWCVRKCPYCDFNSHEAKQALPYDRYADRLLEDLDQHMMLIDQRSLVSIFFGGGTPSLFPPSVIEKILMGVQQRLSFSTDIEITMEANPGTLDEANFRGFREAGVNRLSLGIQSFQDSKLQALGRIHGREHALRAIEIAHHVGFDNVNLDLMHGLPQQSLEDALDDLRDALAWQPPHVSWYQLTIEPNTFFHHRPPVLPEEDVLSQIQQAGKQVLASQHLRPYEVSAYSLAGRECRHNRNYWEFGDYLGIGAGAHSKLTDRYSQVITRHWQVKNPKDYLDLQKSMIASHCVLSSSDVVFEFMLNALRLTQGVSTQLFVERTGLELSMLEPMLSEAIQKKLLVDSRDRLLPTEWGQRFLNDLVGMFLNTKHKE